jgi:hypothetical protein
MQTIFSPDPLVMHQGGTFPFYLILEICREHFSKFEFQLEAIASCAFQDRVLIALRFSLCK